MFDISKISGEHISKLAGAYLHATFVFGADLLEASEKKQHKIRKWISNQYIELVKELPEDANIFSKENSDKDVLLFLKECVDLGESIAEEKENKFELDFAVVNEAAKSALKKLLELEFWREIKAVGSDIKIITDDTPAFRRILTLKNVDAIPMGKEGHYCRNLGMVLQKEQNRFCFYGELEDPVEETTESFALTFENADVEIEVYNSCNNMNMIFLENPWEFLCTISFAIGIKADLPGDYCNAKEKELLSLIKEIVALEYWMELPEQELFSFGELKRMTHKYGYNKAEIMLGKLETIKPGDNSFYKTVEKLIAILCQKQCEPLWREIYNKIAQSQDEYPNKVDSLCDKELLMSVRNDIQTLMESKGYLGTYPDFVKDGVLNGIHLEHSYNMTYFVGMKKRAEYHIHCYESFEENDYLMIHFLCGTALLKKEEQKTDIYDCLFNAKGRRLFHTVQHYILLQAEEDSEADNLETSVTIAVKKAECIRLNKAEQKEFYGMVIPGWGMFWRVFLIGGGMFGIAMTLIMMLLSIITTAAFGMFADIPEMLKTMPWGQLLAIGWIGFGGAMGIVEVLAHRK